MLATANYGKPRTSAWRAAAPRAAHAMRTRHAPRGCVRLNENGTCPCDIAHATMPAPHDACDAAQSPFEVAHSLQSARVSHGSWKCVVMICCKIHETDGMKPFYVWVQRCIGVHTLLSRRHAVELGAHAAYVAVQAPSGGISANLDALFFRACWEWNSQQFARSQAGALCCTPPSCLRSILCMVLLRRPRLHLATGRTLVSRFGARQSGSRRSQISELDDIDQSFSVVLRAVHKDHIALLCGMLPAVVRNGLRR